MLRAACKRGQGRDVYAKSGVTIHFGRRAPPWPISSPRRRTRTRRCIDSAQIEGDRPTADYYPGSLPSHLVPVNRKFPGKSSALVTELEHVTGYAPLDRGQSRTYSYSPNISGDLWSLLLQLEPHRLTHGWLPILTDHRPRPFTAHRLRYQRSIDPVGRRTARAKGQRSSDEQPGHCPHVFGSLPSGRSRRISPSRSRGLYGLAM